jgi:hypothetical protein
VQYSATGDILDYICLCSINLCNCLNRTAYAIEKNALTNMLINLAQLRITKEASSRIYEILLQLYCIFGLFSFLISKHVLHSVYEIPGYFFFIILLF